MMMALEFEILDFIQTYLRTPLGDVVMPWITALGNGGILWVLTGFILLCRKKHRRAAVLLFLALGVEVILCNLCLKNVIAAPRPFTLNPSVKLLIPAPGDYSFPSGHTGAAFAAVWALRLGEEKYWYLALIPAGLIAFSRMYLYVHFPSDILGGIGVGIFSAYLAKGIVKFAENHGRKNSGPAL